MKLSASFSSLLFVVSLLSVVQAASVPGAIFARQNENDVNAAGGANEDPQQSLTLLQELVAPGFASDGLDGDAEAGQAPSKTSTNNFMNFCATPDGRNLPITNGQQIPGGSCNPTVIGVIPSVDNMPACAYVFPKNFDVVEPNVPFTVQMRITRLTTGAFTNPQQRFFGSPQEIDGSGNIIGHSHTVIEQIASFEDTTPLNPENFAFFKGFNDAAENGILSAEVTAGLPAGDYRICSINTAANHAPALVPVAQHGSLDCCTYFTAGANNTGQNNGGNAGTGQPQNGQGQNGQTGQGQNGQNGQGQNNQGQNQNGRGRGGQGRGRGGGRGRN